MRNILFGHYLLHITRADCITVLLLFAANFLFSVLECPKPPWTDGSEFLDKALSNILS